MRYSRTALALLTTLPATAALAHHPMGGVTPSTWFEGLLSGFGHPIIGLDHLAFVIAVGLLSLGFARRLLMPLAFVAATLVGTAVHLQTLTLPAAEWLIAASLIVAGAALLLRLTPGAALALSGFAAAGVFHGYAYGEAVVGAETAPLLAYLFGFALIQYAIATAALLSAERALTRRPQLLRLGGAAIAAIGALFLLQNVVG